MQYAGLELVETESGFTFKDPALNKAFLTEVYEKFGGYSDKYCAAIFKIFADKCDLKTSYRAENYMHRFTYMFKPADREKIRRFYDDDPIGYFFRGQPLLEIGLHRGLYPLMGAGLLHRPKTKLYACCFQQPNVSLELYQSMEIAAEKHGFYIDISYQDGWHRPGLEPLIIVSHMPLALTK